MLGFVTLKQALWSLAIWCRQKKIKSSLVDVKVFYCIDIRSLLRQICEQMHWTDSYSKVTWCKSSELDKHDRCCNGVACTVGHLRRPIPHLNPTPVVDIDQFRFQARVLASSSI